MKFAFLILAHNEFEVLQHLVNALDDPRNDIYIHYDKKVGNLPRITTKNSGLFVCEERIDVRWGDVSMLEAEYALWKLAYSRGKYSYYHLISGVHFPLKSQCELHHFFESLGDKNVLMGMEVSYGEIDSKIKKYNFFIKNFVVPNKFIRFLSQHAWRILIRFQKILGISRNRPLQYKKASVWVSLTEDGIAHMLSVERNMLKEYKYTFCGDEFFVASELWNSPLRNKMFFYDKMLKCDFVRANCRVYTTADLEMLLSSDCLFARKFSSMDLSVVKELENHIWNKPNV